MIKKISLIFFCYCLVVSCGKKGDPIYGDPKKEAAIQIVHLNRA